MLIFHPVELEFALTRDHPLYVGHFFPLKGMWWKKRKQRQSLILSLAVAWYRSMKRNPGAPGFINEEVLITSLTSQVSDAKVILEKFFDITRVGFNFNDGNKSPTQVSPRKLDKKITGAISEIIDAVHFAPGPEPHDARLVKSKLYVRTFRANFIRHRLAELEREDLLPAVNWLLKYGEIDFYYEPAGKLQARDKSVWPVKSIELWPGWLRTELFGKVIDIENAYCQFVVSKLQEKYASNIKRLELKYPDLLRMDRDKSRFREEICRDVLGLPVNDDGISIVKKLMMSLANGSNATPGLMLNDAGRSEAVRIVLHANPDLMPSELIEAGRRLSSIAKQFKAAKKDLCIFLLNVKPTRENQKLIFKMYLEWERKSRYSIWDATGRGGLMLHDGLDGISSSLSDADLELLVFDKTRIRVSVDSPIAY